MTRYLEDLPVGMAIALGSVTVDAGEMVAFAERFDPQTFHVDPAGAARTPFGSLIASGWFTGALFMRLFVDGFLHDIANLGGSGLDALRFPHPVRAGDVLGAEVLVVESRPSERKLDRGTLVVDGTVTNQDAISVLTLSTNVRVARRPTLS